MSCMAFRIVPVPNPTLPSGTPDLSNEEDGYSRASVQDVNHDYHKI